MSKIIAVHSYRGGTGKSNLVANLATTLALAGYRVGVVDADLQSPGIHNIFDLTSDRIQHTLNDYLWGLAAIDDVGYDVSQSSGLKTAASLILVPASINPDDIARVLNEGYSSRQLNEGLRQIIQHFKLNYLLIDTHPGLSRETFFSIAIAHLLLLLIRPDRQDYQGTAVTVDLARQLRVPEMKLIANKTLKNMDLIDFKQQLETTYRVPVAGIFPLSEEMIKLGSDGIFCQIYPTHPWSDVLREITQQIL